MSQLPNSLLQLSREEMRKPGYRVIDQIVDHFTSLPEKPVTPAASRSDLEGRLREPLPELGADASEVLNQLQRDVWSNMMHLDHPRFFAFVPSPNNFVGAMADALVAGLNPFAGTWLEASGPAQIELVTVDWLRQLTGLPETAGGHFVTGGSAANLTALAIARHVKLDDQRESAVIYFSDQTHSSIERALKLLGFTRAQICKLPSDGRFRMPVEELEKAILKDRAVGKRPFCVVANAGTTNTGTVDPLPKLAELCAREGVSANELNTLNQRLIGKTIEDGFAFVSSTNLKGRTVLRLCTINPRTTDEDVITTIQRLEQFGHNLRPGQ
jgi:glutamate/tyrosine decarboxylase-like PLP-dependent enzyme